MNYPNGQTVSDVKKNVSSGVSKVASDLRSDAKSLAAKAERKAESIVSDVSADVSNELSTEARAYTSSPLANTVIATALSYLPVQNPDEVIQMLETTLKDIKASATTARDSATSFVRKYPIASALGAVAIGAGAYMLYKNRSSTTSRRRA